MLSACACMTNDIWTAPHDDTPCVPLFTRKNVMLVLYFTVFGAALGAGIGGFIHLAREPLFETTAAARLLLSDEEKDHASSDAWFHEQEEALKDAVALTEWGSDWRSGRQVEVSAVLDRSSLLVTVHLTCSVRSDCSQGIAAFFGCLTETRNQRGEESLASQQRKLVEMTHLLELATLTLTRKLGCQPWEKQLTAEAKAAMAKDADLAAAHAAWKQEATKVESAHAALMRDRSRHGLDAPRFEITQPPGEPEQRRAKLDAWQDFLVPAMKGGGSFGGIAVMFVLLRHKARTRPGNNTVKPAAEF